MCLECVSDLTLLTGDMCLRCGSPRSALEQRTQAKAGEPTPHRGGGRYCRDCRRRDIQFACARSAVAYQRGAVRMLGAWKEGGTSRLAQVAASIIVGVVPRPSSLTLTPIPPDRDRALWRGHDAARALARALASE